jgi:hypothetical protein
LLLDATTSCLGTFVKPSSISRTRVLDGEIETLPEPQSLASTSLQELMREMLVRLGEDLERDGLQ